MRGIAGVYALARLWEEKQEQKGSERDKWKY